MIKWSTQKGNASVHIGHVGKVILFAIKPSLLGGSYHLLVRTIPSIAAPDRARDWTRVEQDIPLERAKELAEEVWGTAVHRLGLKAET